MAYRIPKGFMLIELMVALAIAAILLAIAIPAYNGYAVRARVTEALHLAAPVEVAVTESLQVGSVPGPALSIGHIFCINPLGMCQLQGFLSYFPVHQEY